MKFTLKLFKELAVNLLKPKIYVSVINYRSITQIKLTKEAHILPHLSSSIKL